MGLPKDLMQFLAKGIKRGRGRRKRGEALIRGCHPDLNICFYAPSLLLKLDTSQLSLGPFPRHLLL
jgi:hypothetical protein